MSYKVLYRKYRPSFFSDIVDQKFITDTLKESIITNKISHAYIFSGPKGTGKTSTAKVFAKAINCEKPIYGEPCNQCPSCLNFDKSADIIELDAASNNKVEDIREIINNVKLAPANSKYKIYIIDEVHMLTSSAANAFLLTLEEPPSHAVFILATTNPESLPQTILSRCQQFAFSKISKKALIDRIKYVLSQENIQLSEDVIKEIAEISDGGLRDALSVLDQLITLNKPIDINLLNEQFGIVSESVINNLIDAIIKNDISVINEIFYNLKEYGYSEKTFINKFISNLTNKICEIKEKNQFNYENLKQIIFEIIKIDNYKLMFNAYDVIKMIILTNIHKINMDSNDQVSLQKNIDEIVEDEKNNVSFEQKSDTNISREIKKQDETALNLQQVNKISENLVNIRINNSFTDANKKLKSEFEKNKNEILEKIKVDKDLYSLLIDVEVGVVSPTNILFICETDATAQLLNENSTKIINILCLDKKIVFVDKNRWKKLTDEYLKNKENKIKYKYISEPEISEDVSEIENIANNIFGDENLIVEE